MKPNFALTLSFEGIGLLLRNGAAWDRVGEVPLDVPDLPQALELLRKSAAEVSPEPQFVKLVLPADQIKFLRLADPAGGRDVQEAAVRAALDGATPYALEELSYDFAETKGELTVAAVAQETLEEAEAFALAHGFKPIYFTAHPEPGLFAGEPHFGETVYYAEHADALGKLEEDDTAIEVGGVALPPEDVALPEPELAPEPEPEPKPQSEETAAHPVTAPSVTSPNVTAPRIEAEEPEGPRFSLARSEAPTDGQASESSAAPAFSSRRGEGAVKAPALEGVQRHAPKAEAPQLRAATPSQTPAPEAHAPDGPKGQAEATPPTPPLQTAAAPQSAAARAQRRTAEITGAAMSFFSRRAKPETETEAPSAKSTARRALPSLRSPRSSEPAAALPPPNVLPRSESEKQRLTVFGARQPEESAREGFRPRFLGLILTAVLLIFLIGVGAWASIFSEEGLSRLFGRSESRIATAPENAPDELAAEGLEAGVSEDDLRLAALQSGDDLEPNAPRADVIPTQRMTLQEAQETYAVTGVWPLAPATPSAASVGNTDDLYVPSIDPAITAQDALALPQLADSAGDDARPSEQANPAAAGQTFALDTRGLVVATPEGTLSPDGHMVFAGKPPYFPTALPERSAVATPEATQETNRLAGFRPKARPQGLIEANERANLGGLSLRELASKRPKLRPPSASQRIAADSIRPEAPQETAVPRTPGAVVIAVQTPETDRSFDPNATAQAVARSVKPQTRPRNFSRIVKRAESNRQQEATQVAAVAPRTVSPSVPSRASVAKQATQRNAINLRRVNLIGVYGKPSSRRALVRLANGRYKKVKVGDRIDGGRVSAIGDSELRYQKSGRNVTLKMPRG